MILITGSGGLIGSEAVKRFIREGYEVIGIDNDSREIFFGEAGSVRSSIATLSKIPGYTHYDMDITNEFVIDIFSKYGSRIECVIHTAAQPSHDWAATNPLFDFEVNAKGTLILLEGARKYCPEAVFIFTSTNKVYGDTPNKLPLIEKETRWEIAESHPYFGGIDEKMSIDNSKHSLFGCSKAYADLIVQEYGRYFGMKTVCFRGGCLTGSNHSGVPAHGFLNYLVRCVSSGMRYNINGYKGKQVRDNIHASDVVSAFWEFFKKPACGKVYNLGGGRRSHCSILEAMEIAASISKKKPVFTVLDKAREGDHIWYVSDMSSFRRDYPRWEQKHTIQSIIQDIYDFNRFSTRSK